MRPMRLTLSAFGPYPKEETIDFERLAKSGLFLICGKTGSGKTAILDGMTYALYGQSSGGGRGDLSQMRCQFSDQKQKTEISFTFEAQGRIYRFVRGLKPVHKRTGEIQYTPEQAVFVCDGGVFEPLFANPKIKDVDNKARDVTGLTCDQFRQVIILPQGQFERLLVANSAEKEEILVSLFHADQWQKTAEKIAQTVYEKRRRLEVKREQADQILRERSVSTVEEFSKLCSQKAELLHETKERLEQALTKLEQTQKLLEEGLAAEKSFLQLDQLQKEQQELLDEEEEDKKRMLRLAEAVRAAELMPLYEKQCLAEEECEKRENQRKQSKENLAQAEKNCVLAREEEEKIRALLPQQERRRREIERDQVILPEFDRLAELSESKAEAEKQCTDAAERVKKEERELSYAQEARLREEKHQAALYSEYSRQFTVYTRCIGGVLAAELKDGEPCPVCGSREHPHPASAEQDSVTEADITRLRNEIEEVTEAVKQEREKEASCLDRCKNVIEHHLNCERTVRMMEKEVQTLTERLSETAKNRAELIRRIEENTAWLKQYEDQVFRAQERSGKTAGEYEAARAMLIHFTEEAQRSAQEQEVLQSELLAALTAAGWESREALAAAFLDEPVRHREAERHAAYEADKNRIAQEIDKLQRELKNMQRPDTHALRVEQTEAQQTFLELSEKTAVLKDGLQRDEAQCKRLESMFAQIEKEWAKNTEDLAFARLVRGDSGVGLQRYVLGVMLSAVTREANRLLSHVHDGRYTLYRTTETSGRVRKTGLELEVFDSFSGERRSVSGLSGGEKFLVALSLSIGLSAVVQAQSGGIRLGAMFIDEGFGSLDRTSVGDALSVLADMKAGTGMVGIISHIEALRETIPSKILVHKAKDGSRLSFSDM